MRIALRSTFQSLSVRNYRLFATGQLISQVFSWVQITAQDWLVLQVSGNSPTALGVVTALQFTPIMLFTLYSGKLADRYEKRTLLRIVACLRLLLAGTMGVIVVAGAAQLWHVFLFAALWGTVTALENPARQSFAAEMVGRKLLPNALALSSATFNTARVVGPAIGGVAIAALGTGAAFIANAMFYAGPLVALTLMNPAELHRERRATDGVPASEARVVDGLRYVLRRPDLILPLALMLVVGMMGFNFQLTLSVLAKNVFHTGAASFGLLTTSLAVGALSGALAGSGRRSRPSVWTLLGAAMAFGACETVAGLGPTYGTTALLLVPTGFFMIFLAQAANQRLQLGVSADLRGRVMALYAMVFLGTNPIGAPLVGWVADTFSARVSIWFGGAVSMVVASAALLVRLRVGGSRGRPGRIGGRDDRPGPPASPADVAPRWQGDEHGASAATRKPLRRFHAIAAGRRRPSGRTGAELSRVDG